MANIFHIIGEISEQRHMSKELESEMEALTRGIHSLSVRTWHDERQLRFIGEGFAWLKRTWWKEWRVSGCAMGSWKTPMPRATHVDYYLVDGVRYGQFSDSVFQGLVADETETCRRSRAMVWLRLVRRSCIGS